MLAAHPAFAELQKTENWLESPVTLKFRQKTLQDVLKEISKQTGISILYDEDLADERVTGNFKGVKASEAINRLFSRKNKSIQVDKSQKVIIVKTFGAKNFIWAREGLATKNEGGETTHMTISDLGKMQKQQYKEYKESIQDENEIIKGDTHSHDMTRGEIKALHILQYKEYKTSLQDKDFFVPSGDSRQGMTRGEILALHNTQYQQYIKQMAQKDEVIKGGKDGEGDMTRQEIRDLHSQQYQEYKASISNTENSVTYKPGLPISPEVRRP